MTLGDATSNTRPIRKYANIEARFRVAMAVSGTLKIVNSELVLGTQK